VGGAAGSSACGNDGLESTPAPTLVLTLIKDQGPHKIEGLVTFPGAIEHPVTASVLYWSAPPSRLDGAKELAMRSLPAGARSLRILLDQVPAGPAYLAVVVDLNSDGRTGTGDWVGFHGGKGEEPVLRAADAQPITVSGKVKNANFPLGEFSP
jgi:hypothetical protein